MIQPLGSGTSGQVLSSTGTATEWIDLAAGQWSVSGSDIYYNSGSVGIGTASPSKTLHVNENDSECVIVVTSSDSGTAGIYFGDQSDEIIGGVIYDNSTDKLQLRSSNNNTAVTIDSSERVGIGTTTPSGELHVNNASSASDVYISSETTSDAIIALQTNTGGSAREARIGYDYSASLVKIINGAAFSGATTGINIDTSGNVGIGSNSFADKLHVQGNAKFTGALLSSHLKSGSASLAFYCFRVVTRAVLI